MGISATQAGVEQAQNDKATEIVKTGVLLDESGKANRELTRELHIDWAPKPEHCELGLAGLFITAAAIQASKFFRRSHTENHNYNTVGGFQVLERVAADPIKDPQQSQTLRDLLNAPYPVKNLQARVVRHPHPDYPNTNHGSTELGQATYVGNALCTSMSTSVRTYSKPEEGVVSAEIAAGFRQGDFAFGDPNADFSWLGRYSSAIIEHLR